MLKHLSEWTGDPTETVQLIRFLLESKLWKEENPDLLLCTLHEKIGQSFCDFLVQLPPKSPFRLALLNIATTSGPALKELQMVLPFSYSTLKRAKALLPVDNLLLAILYKPKVTRQMISSEEIDAIIHFLLEVCPVKSGSNQTLQNPENRDEKQPKHWQFITDKELYEQYKVEFTRQVNATTVLC